MAVTMVPKLLRREILEGENAGVVDILNDDGKIVIKRKAERNGIVNRIDRYEHITERGTSLWRALDEETANKIVDSAKAGTPWSACFVLDDSTEARIEWQRSPEEHKYTSTGIKFWRHREAMESYRASTGRTVISTHISPEGACNLRCPFCSVTFRETHSSIPYRRIQQYVLDLKTRGLKAVILTGGGEPTLYPQFNALVGWLREQDLQVALITNGTMPGRVSERTWRAFSWVRVSVNIFDGWREKIRIPTEHLDPKCVVGCSFVYTVEHEATDAAPLDRAQLFKQVAEVADKCGAVYVRVLPNCLLPQRQLLAQHRAIDQLAPDKRFFHQFKVHGAPSSSVCHQAYFRPYLSEEPFDDGEPGTVYPCDSVVLNQSVARFAGRWGLCKPEQVLDFLDGKIKPRFDPRLMCGGCVFTDNVNLLDRFKRDGTERFAEFPTPLVHEDFV